MKISLSYDNTGIYKHKYNCDKFYIGLDKKL